MERLPNRYPKISQSHKVPLYKGLSLFYPKLQKNVYKKTVLHSFVEIYLTFIVCTNHILHHYKGKANKCLSAF